MDVKCEWIVVCGEVYDDGNTQELRHLIDVVWVTDAPVQHEGLAYAARFIGAPGAKFEGVILITSPSGQTVVADKVSMSFSPYGNATYFRNLPPVVFPELGLYLAQVFLGKPVAETRFLVIRSSTEIQ